VGNDFTSIEVVTETQRRVVGDWFGYPNRARSGIVNLCPIKEFRSTMPALHW